MVVTNSKHIAHAIIFCTIAKEKLKKFELYPKYKKAHTFIEIYLVLKCGLHFCS